MSVIIRASGNIGPFKSIETLSDRLRCDGTDYPFSVIGSYSISENNELAPAPIVPPPVIPDTLPRWAAHKILKQHAKFGAVQTAINAIVDPDTKDLFDTLFKEAPTVRRQSQFVTYMIGAGVFANQAEIDGYFIEGGVLEKSILFSAGG
mgnify:CR=1 FL=1